MPRVVTTAGIALAALLLARELRHLRSNLAGRSWSAEIAGALRTFAWIAGFIVLLRLVGFVPALLVFTSAFLLFVAGMRPRRAVVYTLAAASVALALPWLLPIALPDGLIA
jgi:putative tricarboxylic transport membrane protein